MQKKKNVLQEAFHSSGIWSIKCKVAEININLSRKKKTQKDQTKEDLNYIDMI